MKKFLHTSNLDSENDEVALKLAQEYNYIDELVFLHLKTHDEQSAIKLLLEHKKFQQAIDVLKIT